MITLTSAYTTICCASCGITFAIPDDFETNRRNDGESFYCPNGHANVFKSRIRELQEKLFNAEREMRSAKCETAAARIAKEEAERKLEEADRKLARVKNGVCPCCNRSFLNLQKHIKAKHPDFKTKAA